MDIALSDWLTCPRCGPEYGLILLPDEVRDRRVESGVLGCANCRERFPVVAGVADLRVSGGGEEEAAADSESGPGSAPESGREEAVKVAALLGLAEARGHVLLAGPAGGLAREVSELVPEVGLVTVAVGGGDPGGAGVASRLRGDAALPVRTGSMRGVALTGPAAALLSEGVRVLGPGGRLLVDPAGVGVREEVEALGLTVVLEESGVVVASRSRP